VTKEVKTELNQLLNQKEWLFFKKSFHKQKNKLHLQTQNGSGIIAQSVEQRTENPCVAGSIPADTTEQEPFSVN
jgi:hypothetical protein